MKLLNVLKTTSLRLGRRLRRKEFVVPSVRRLVLLIMHIASVAHIDQFIISIYDTLADRVRLLDVEDGSGLGGR